MVVLAVADRIDYVDPVDRPIARFPVLRKGKGALIDPIVGIAGDTTDDALLNLAARGTEKADVYNADTQRIISCVRRHRDDLFPAGGIDRCRTEAEIL